jgi:uncharacterized protein YbjT (DUF2867 family)
MVAVKVLVAGASGFVGRRLCLALAEAGHDVVAMTRNPGDYAGAGTPVYGDVRDPGTLSTAMADCDAAYYLVHSLSDADFERKDAELPRPSARPLRWAACSASFTSEASATTRTPCRHTFAAAVRSRSCSEREASR